MMLKKEIYNFYFPIIKKYKTLFLLMLLSGVITWISTVWMPLFLKMETDQLVEKKWWILFWNSLSWFEVFIVILWIILLVNLIETIIRSITDIFSKSKQDLLKNEIQFHLFKKMENMEIGRSMNARYKYISDIVDSDFPTVSNTIIYLPRNTIEFIIQLFWMTFIYAYFDMRLLLLVVWSAVLGYLIEVISRKISKKYEIDWKFTLGRQVYKYSNLFLYNFSNLATSWWLSSTIQTYADLLNQENKNSVKRDFSGLVWNMQNLINYSLRDILLKWIVGYWVFIGTNSVGMVVLVVSSMGTLGWLISQILSFRNNYKDFVFQQESILLMLKICSEVGNTEYTQKIEKIEFQDVYFSYPNLAIYEQEYFEILQKNIIGKDLGNNWLDEKIKILIETMDEESKIAMPEVFSGISFEFEKGKVYGIVGKNGAGKTTLMYLLSWFFRGYQWKILFNGINTKDFISKSFLDTVSFLTQTPFMLDWSSTVRENLFLWVWNEVWEEKAWYYLELFWLAKKIRKHKKWLDAETGNDLEFSGWERQIITFIRILLQNREIVIMDEWTNQLDAENEILVMNELLKQKHNKIIIFITHRMSTISKADEIYCLENGIFWIKGNHKTLLEEKQNAYARFYSSQVLHE